VQRDDVYYDDLTGRLYTAVLSDVLDDLGARNQVLHPDVRPVYEGAAIVGRAATMLAVPASEIPDEPYKLMMQTLDSIQPGEVVVCAVRGSENAGMWGELLSVHTRARGGRGAILDGLTRDVWGIVDMQFPVFATGRCPADSKGRVDVVEARTSIEVGGVVIADRDLVVADVDGVIVVPQNLEEEAVAQALEKVAGENTIRDVLAAGASLEAVFKEYGIL
jgi:regulator of RNase E activity RraA